MINNIFEDSYISESGDKMINNVLLENLVREAVKFFPEKSLEILLKLENQGESFYSVLRLIMEGAPKEFWKDRIEILKLIKNCPNPDIRLMLLSGAISVPPKNKHLIDN